MASNLYEVLDLSGNASPDEIRKAYRKLALKTHPDRLPPNSTQAEKEAANERFRLVNNAYEVLNDPKNRELYDRTGVWPPVAPEEVRHSPRGQSFGRPGHPFFGDYDPFSQDPLFQFSHPFFSSGSRSGMFGFTDPFVLFNSIFGDIHNQSYGGMRDPLFGWADHNDFMGNMTMSAPFGGLSTAHEPSQFFNSSFTQIDSLGGGSGDGQWVSQSRVTQTINGRTQTIIKQRDAQGNEHVRYQSPDGDRYTINGVEQLAQRRDITDGTRQTPPAPPPTGASSRWESIPLQNKAPRSTEHHRSSSLQSHSSHRSHHTPPHAQEPYVYSQSGPQEPPQHRLFRHEHPRDTNGAFAAPQIADHSHRPSHASFSIRSRYDTPPPAYSAPYPATDVNERRRASSRRETYAEAENVRYDPSTKSRHNGL